MLPTLSVTVTVIGKVPSGNAPSWSIVKGIVQFPWSSTVTPG
nr:hypothetical protein [Budvicia aquatica]